MKTTLLIQLLNKAGWRQNRKVNNDLIFTHIHYTNLISVPDMGDQEIKPELLNEIFQAARLKARVHKITGAVQFVAAFRFAGEYPEVIAVRTRDGERKIIALSRPFEFHFLRAVQFSNTNQH